MQLDRNREAIGTGSQVDGQRGARGRGVEIDEPIVAIEHQAGGGGDLRAYDELQVDDLVTLGGGRC